MVKDLNDPTNVDSIEAMLTPGEFVLNKEATTMFGPMIEKMNNMGLQQRHAENQAIKANKGMMIPQMSPSIPQYNTGGLITFLKDKEGYKDKAYQDSAGVWTIGYGRTGDIKKGDTTTRAAEDTWLDQRAGEELGAINAYAEKYGYDWNDGQKNALASFRYNGGQGMIDQLTAEGTRDNATIQSKFGLYNKVTNPDTGEKEFVQGLQNRRDAELGLWGGTTPTETPAAEPANAAATTTQAVIPDVQEAPPLVGQREEIPTGPDINAVPFPEAEAPEVAAAGGFPDVSGGVTNALSQVLAPPPPVQAPPIQAKGPAPEYIPSVTERSNPQVKNSLWNDGGSVQYLRGGGKAGQEKVWDSATQKYVWVDRSDPRVEQEKALAAQAPAGKPRTPLAFAQASKPDVSHLGPRQYKAPYQQSANLPLSGLMQFDRSPDDIGDQVQRGWTKEDFDIGAQSQPGLPPQLPREFQSGPAQSSAPQNITPLPQPLQDLPPVPGSDEALLQGSSQVIEQQETATPPSIDQVPPQSPTQVAENERQRQNALLGDQAKQFPKGDPRRATLFNQQQHQKGAVHPGVVPELPPQIPAGPNEHPLAQGVDPNAPIPNPAAPPPGPNTHPLAQGVDPNAPIPNPEAPPSQGGAGRGRGSWHQEREQLLSSLPEVELPQTERQAQALTGGYDTRLEDASAALDKAINSGDVKAITKAEKEITKVEELVEKQVVEQARSDEASQYKEAAKAWSQANQVNIAADKQVEKLEEAKRNTENASTQALIDQKIAEVNSEKVDVGEPPIPQGVAAGTGSQGPAGGAEQTAERPLRTLPTEDKQEAGNDMVTAAANQADADGEPPMPETNPVTIEAAGTQSARTNPGGVQSAKDTITGAFGDLFDSGELARAAIMFVGALATGASPGRALAFAGQGYLQRLDAKAAGEKKHIQDLVKGNKYDAASIEAYKESGDASDLVQKGTPRTPTGTLKTFYSPSGKEVRTSQVKIGDGKYWQDSNGNLIDPTKFKEDASQIRGSKEWNKRIIDDGKAYEDTLSALQEQLGASGTGEDKRYQTGIVAKAEGKNISRWALNNNVDASYMDDVIKQAYQQAAADSRGGKKVTSIQNYLDNAYVTALTGSPELFQTSSGQSVSGEKVADVFGRITRRAQAINPDYKNMTSAAINTRIMSIARDKWSKIDPDAQKQWNKQAPKGQNGFLMFLRSELDDRTLIK